MPEGDSEYWKQALIAGRKARRSERTRPQPPQKQNSKKHHKKQPKSRVSTRFVVRGLFRPSDPRWFYLTPMGYSYDSKDAEVFRDFEEAENLVLDNRSAHPTIQFRYTKA